MAAIFSVSALFFGIALMMLGNGLQGSLLGLRGSLEGFSTSVLGLVMSGYFVGFLAGSLFAPRFVGRVGHIRVFAALASLASAAVLLHSVFLDPWVWGLMRVVTGFSYAGLYIVAESWINDMSDNQNRGRLLGAYMVIQLGAVAGGQYLLQASDPGGANLFMLVAVLVSLAVLPVCLSASRAPDFSAPEAMSFVELYRVSPLGVVGMVLVGMASGTIFGFGAVYAQRAGLTVGEISTFVASLFIGGMVLQWPIGRLSDRFDRRVVITVVSFGAAGAALFAVLLPPPVELNGARHVGALFAAMALLGGLAIPLYSLFTAHVNDHVPVRKMVAASSGLIFLNGAGAIAGPNIAAAVMDEVGNTGFFVTLVGVHALVGLFTLYRMTRRAAPSAEQQVDFVAMPVRGTAVVGQMASEWIEQNAGGEGPGDDDGGTAGATADTAEQRA